MNQLPVKEDLILKTCRELGIKNFETESIREIVQLVNKLEEITGIQFIRTEMGVPGLPAPQIAVEAETDALKKGIASIYPPIEGYSDLKNELSRFMKLFLNIEVNAEGCIPTTGSMQASIASFIIACRRNKRLDTVLFIDPGFPVHKRQVHMLGHKFESFDIYNFRGEKLQAKLESYLEKGNISTFIYSNPNNPSWICLTEKELQIIGTLANKNDIIVIEDLAYLAMDFREDYGKPGRPPFQPTIARFTDNYLLLFSSSKIFSYAGQRIGSVIISDKLFHKKFPDLEKYFSSNRFGQALIQDAIYALSAGTSISSQIGLASILRSASDGDYDFVAHVREYGERAKRMKKLFLENGFRIVYDKDEERLLADGFYFTISYPGYQGGELLSELLRYGISALTLNTSGSDRSEGLRICVSHTQLNDMPVLKERLEIFRTDHS